MLSMGFGESGPPSETEAQLPPTFARRALAYVPTFAQQSPTFAPTSTPGCLPLGDSDPHGFGEILSPI